MYVHTFSPASVSQAIRVAQGDLDELADTASEAAANASAVSGEAQELSSEAQALLSDATTISMDDINSNNACSS